MYKQEKGSKTSFDHESQKKHTRKARFVLPDTETFH